MKQAHFRVSGRLNTAGARGTEGTVTIDRGNGEPGSALFNVRPLRRRRVYTLPLSTVAELVVFAIVRQEAREKLAERRARRRR